MSTKNLSLPKSNLHHAYVIIGERASVREELFNFFADDMGVATTGNPDFSYLEFNNLGIDDARALTETQSRKDFGSDKKFFVIAVNSIGEEAQNALLKVFEEPTAGTHFFILAGQNNFLPTFLSRVQILQPKVRPWEPDLKVEPWVVMNLPERLALVAKLAGDISDEKKVKQDAINVINHIESELAQDVEKNAAKLKACGEAREALLSRGAMTKMVLENLMLRI